MPKKEAPLDQLSRFLPPGTLDAVSSYLHHYKIHLTITRERKSILGDYRHRTNSKNHRISVNGNLNPYAFLITLVHEIAHLLAFEEFGNRISAHGKEWKNTYAKLLQRFLEKKTFPDDISHELRQSLKNPAAASCAEDSLIRVLRKYNNSNKKNLLVEEIRTDSLFRLQDGRIFRKGERLRKRYKCVETVTGKIYLFSPVYEVEQVNEL